MSVIRPNINTGHRAIERELKSGGNYGRDILITNDNNMLGMSELRFFYFNIRFIIDHALD